LEVFTDEPLNSSPPTSFHPAGAAGAVVVVVVGAAVVVVVGAAVVVGAGAAVVGTVASEPPLEGVELLPGTVVTGWHAAKPSITIPAAIARAARGVFESLFIALPTSGTSSSDVVGYGAPPPALERSERVSRHFQRYFRLDLRVLTQGVRNATQRA
jgi:hypothetical protein